MDMRMARRASGVAVLGLMASCGGSDGPTTPPPAATGTVSGTVTASGEGVSGAVISLAGKGTQTTGASGAFTFSQVAVGNHAITLSTIPDGFELGASETAAKTAAVTANQTTTVNWSLAAESQGGATTQTVNMTASTFSPSSVTVKVGSTIVWVNGQAILHTITPDGHSAWNRVETSSTGEVLRVTLNTAGEYDYHCEIHSGMTGEIVVEP